MAKRRGRNEGSITQRENGTWRVQISQDGNRVSYSAKTKVECQEWLQKTQKQIQGGMDFEKAKSTLGEYLLEWLENNQAGLRHKTAHQYRMTINKHILPDIGKTRLKDLRLDMVEQFYARLQKNGVGVRTIRIIHAVLHKALEKAVRYGFVPENLAHGAVLPRYKHEEMRIYDETQVTQFLIAAKTSRLEALYHMAVVTGMRQGELYALKWSDLNWLSGRIYVQRQVQQIRGQPWEMLEPKTRSGRRVIKLGEGVLQSLRQHLERQKLERAAAGERWQDFDLIFPSTVGTPLGTSNVRANFNRVLELAGLPRIRFHDLRHTAASIMLNHDIPIVVVSKILGHARPSITMDIYGHLIMERQDEAARLMDSLVTPIPVDLPTGAKVGKGGARVEK